MAQDQDNNQGGQKEQQGKKQLKYKIKIPQELEAGVYANAISVHCNSNEFIIDMAYKIANPEETVIKVVSRINMTHKTAESFLKVFSNALLDWKNKQKEHDEKNNNNPIPPA